MSPRLMDGLKALVALTVCVAIVIRFRRQLAAMPPEDAARAKRKFALGMLAAAILIAAILVILLQTSAP